MLLHSMLQYVILAEVYEENPASFKYVLRKKKSSSTAFPNNSGCSSLILHQNSTSGGFLKVSCNVESKTTFFSLPLWFITGY